MALSKPYRPWHFRLINAMGELLSTVGIRPSIQADYILKKAIKQSGFDDLGNNPDYEGLEVLVASIERQSKLNTIGRLTSQKMFTGFMSNRLQLEDWFTNHPEELQQKIEKPLFIIGLPRTGTTILHNLMWQDPSNRAPLMWEINDPMPRPEADHWHDDPRIAVNQNNLDTLNRLATNFLAIHEVAATLPQECVGITQHMFYGITLFLHWHVPDYRQWLLQTDPEPALRYHKRFLQMLQATKAADRWLLKSPGHLNVLPTLFKVYPDAQVVFTHRNPVEVIGSICSLVWSISGMASDKGMDPLKIGQEQSLSWNQLLERAMIDRAALPQHKDQFHDLYFSDLVADPEGSIKDIYKNFNLPLPDNMGQRITNFLAQNPQNKYGKHHYDLADFGLSEAGERQRFDKYIQQYQL
jgi:hypothetical protein